MAGDGGVDSFIGRTGWPETKYNISSLINGNANKVLLQSICKAASECCVLCSGHGECHFEKVL